VDDGPERTGGAGGILGRPWLDALAVAATVGIDPVAVQRADPIERELMLAVIDGAVRRQEERDEALARRIIAALAEAIKRGRR
jgi:hypothetical protein